MYRLEEHWSDFLDGDNGALGKLYAEVFEPLVFRAIYYTRESEIARDGTKNKEQGATI
ncbi:MAG: hypothetical protein LW688_01205 [Cryomorphaceae bacterium]|nr:hypothetical protein [Cryomorphaceae bacterium]